ncbi:MAG TPA: stage II sporulation protein M, partial [Anaerolineales bacterium]|nr:stage II sporulation protein M [Anaerolineales bacterium]
LSHFRREYLLGREIDTLNFKQIGRTFRDRFVGEAHSIFEWFLTELPLTLKQLRQPLRVIYGVAIVAGIVSYLWVVIEAPSYLHLTQERLTELRASITENPINLSTLGDRLPSAPMLFYYNARTTVVTLLLGLVSFGTMGVTVFIANIALVGGVLGGAQLVGYSPWLVFVVGILPHGIFELPAIFLATAAMLKVGAQLVTPQSEKSLGEILLLSLADWLRIFVGLVLPLLAVAALIEIYVTPTLIRLALPYF